MKRPWLLSLLIILTGTAACSTTFASSLSIDAGYHYQNGASGVALSLLYTHGIFDWFEFGADFQYWIQLGEKEIDNWTQKNPEEDTDWDEREFRELRQETAGFFGPVFRFPLTWRKNRFLAVVPTLGVGVEMMADREWVEETIRHEAAPDEENVHNEDRQYGFGWYLRPGLTFVVGWWRIGYEHFVSQDGAAQFQAMTGIDIFRITGYSK